MLAEECQKDLWIKWLVQNTHTTEPLPVGCRLVVAGHDHHRNRGEPLVPQLRVAKLEARHSWHLQIQNNEIRAEAVA